MPRTLHGSGASLTEASLLHTLLYFPISRVEEDVLKRTVLSWKEIGISLLEGQDRGMLYVGFDNKWACI